MKHFQYALLAALLPIYASADDVNDLQQTQNTTLSMINVVSEENNGVNDGYTVSATNTPFGLSMTLRDIPQSISVVTKEQLRDQNIKKLDRTLAQVTGVSQQIYGSDRAGYNYVFARGSRITNYQLNGIPVGEGLSDVGNMNTAAYERVEVLRGVNGLLNGSGEPSATVNLVRKRPTATPLAETTLSVGSRKHTGLFTDISGGLNTDNSLRGRVVLDTERGDSWRQRERTRDIHFYGILEYVPTAQTQLYVGADYQYAKQNQSASHSFVTYDSQGYATMLGPKDNPAAGWAYSRIRTLNLFVGIEHRFNEDWKIKAEYDYLHHQWDHPYGVAGVLAIDHATGRADMIPGYWQSKPRNHSLSVALNGRYHLFGREHDLIAGINGYHAKDHRHGARNIVFNGVNNVYEFSHTGHYPMPQSFTQQLPQNGEKRQIGGYLATRIRPSDNLSFILGGRYSRYQAGSYERRTQGIATVSASRFTPYTGIVFDVGAGLSLYGSYSSLFVPQSQKDEQGSYLEPVTGQNLEAGIKGEWLEGRLNASATVYRTRKNHLATAAGRDVNGDTYYRAANRATTHGWEVEVAGLITHGWQLQAGYSQSKTRDQDDIRLNSDSIPERSFKLFTTYSFTLDAPQGLTVGTGVRWQSETHTDPATLRIADPTIKARAIGNTKQKAYAVVDIMARYRFNPNVELSLNIDNVFNRKYRTQPDRHSYGELRTVTLAFTYRFE